MREYGGRLKLITQADPRLGVELDSQMGNGIHKSAKLLDRNRSITGDE